jgi:cytochrome c-type biogenesis protein CcmH/NrfG
MPLRLAQEGVYREYVAEATRRRSPVDMMLGYQMLAQFLTDQGRFQEACEVYQNALAMLPDEPAVWRELVKPPAWLAP